MAISWRRGDHGAADGSGTTVAASYASNNLGDAGVFGVGWLDPAGAIDVLSVVDSAGNTWQASPTGKVRNAAQQYAGRMYRVPTGLKASAAANTVTVTFTAPTTFKRLDLGSWKSSNGPYNFDPLDQSAGGTGSGTAMSSGSMTPAQSGEAVIGFGGHGSGNVGATSPYVLREPSGGGVSTGLTERVLSGGSGVAVAAQATGSAPGDWVMLGVTIKDVPGTIQPETTSRAVLPSAIASAAKARPLMSGGATVTAARLMPAMRRSEARTAPVANFWWQSGPPAPLSLPLTWLSQPLSWRLEPPITKAQVTQDAGGPAFAINAAAFAEYKNYLFQAGISTACDADAANLAHFVTTYYPDARMRVVSATVSLLPLSDVDKIRLLQAGIGRRVRFTGIPPEWPVDAQTLVISGIRHDVAVNRRRITFTFDPVVDRMWFRYGVSSYGSTTDVRLW